SRLPRSARVAPGADAADRSARYFAPRQGSRDAALSADRRRHHPHRASTDVNSESRIENPAFAAFAGRKEQAALAAALPPYTTDVERRESDLDIAGNDWSRQ